MKRLILLVVLVVALLAGACNRQDTSDCGLARKKLSELQKSQNDKQAIKRESDRINGSAAVNPKSTTTLNALGERLKQMNDQSDQQAIVDAQARVNVYCK